MDGFTLTAEIIDSLVWPSLILFILLRFNKPIMELVPLLRMIKIKDVEMEFSETLAEMKVEFDNESSQLGIPKVIQMSPSSRLMDMAVISTRAAIIEAWIELERAAVEVASSFWNESPSDVFRNNVRLGEYLYQCKVIDKKQLEFFNNLRELRNQAAHAEEMNLSIEVAESYIQLALALALQIKDTK